MEIVYKKKNTFKMVRIGDVFSWNDSVYMSTQEVTSTSTGEVFNAICMADGECTYFDDNAIVTPVKAQLIIS